MVLFTLIFFAMVIVVGVSMVAGFSFFLKRRTKRLKTENQQKFIDEPPPYRSLFEPDAEEIRALEQEKSAERAAKTADDARLLALKKIEAVRDFQKIWANEPNKLNTVGLFRLAAQSENAEIFSETAETVIEFWREKRIAGLTANDLADLLDSHIASLPQQERTAGGLFWLRREIMSLRAAGSEEKS